jgi:hypothetical protein
MRTHDKERLARAVAESYSIRETLRKLGLIPAGGNYETIKRALARFGIDTAHFTGQGHLKGKTHRYATRPLAEVLKRGRLENTYRLKRRLLAEGWKSRACEQCGRTEWLGHPIPLELHHKDGDRTNNCLDNLELACPNCHALTDNYRAKNRKV